MIAPAAYRFQVRDAVGNFRATVYRDASYILGRQGLRASLTGEQICQEMTLVARNGPLGSDPGLGLKPLDLVTVEVSPDASAYSKLYYGQLRIGGNPNDYSGEFMTFRGLDARLRTTPTPEGSYASMDGGRQADALILSTLTAGNLGRTYTLAQLTAAPTLTDGQIVRYDPARLPNLGFNAPAITATNHQPLGFFLDEIVTAGAAAGFKVRWGVTPDGYITMQVVNTTEVSWNNARATWKPPNAEVIYTAVNWAIERRQDTGKIFYYLSKGAHVADYGAEMKDVQLIGLNPWKPLALTPTYTGTVTATPSGGNTSTTIRDGDLTTSVTVANGSGAGAASLTVPAGGAQRLFVDAQETAGGTSAYIQIQYPAGPPPSGGASIIVRANDVGNNGFTKAVYYPGSGVLLYGLPEGAVINLYAGLTAGVMASTLTVNEFRLELLDTATLDAAATAYYRTPELEPGDLYKPGLLLPSDLGGKVRTVRSGGGGDYVGNVSLWEYTYTSSEGAGTTAKIGDPDDPDQVARSTLIKRLASQATAAAVQASAAL
jgi:hypothetical protein